MGASGSFLVLGWCWVDLHQAADMTWGHGELYNLLAQQSEARWNTWTKKCLKVLFKSHTKYIEI